jgi:hypothetical protein
VPDEGTRMNGTTGLDEVTDATFDDEGRVAARKA